jgi:hypothetical protein
MEKEPASYELRFLNRFLLCKNYYLSQGLLPVKLEFYYLKFICTLQFLNTAF